MSRAQCTFLGGLFLARPQGGFGRNSCGGTSLITKSLESNNVILSLQEADMLQVTLFHIFGEGVNECYR